MVLYNSVQISNQIDNTYKFEHFRNEKTLSDNPGFLSVLGATNHFLLGFRSLHVSVAVIQVLIQLLFKVVKVIEH